MKKIILSLSIITSLFVFNIAFVFACSCIQPTSPKEALKQSTAVFVGEVIDIDVSSGIVISSADLVKVIFEVSKIWKGPDYKTLILTTARDGVSCGYSFEQGKEYIVYARGKGKKLNVSLCSRTKLLANAQEDIEELGEGGAPSVPNSNLPYRHNFIQIFAIGIGILIFVAAVFLINKKFKK